MLCTLFKSDTISIWALRPPALLSAPHKNARKMIDIVPPFRSVFHPQRSVPASNVPSGTKATTTNPQPASRNQYSSHPTNTTDGCCRVRLPIHPLTSVIRSSSLIPIRTRWLFQVSRPANGTSRTRNPSVFLQDNFLSSVIGRVQNDTGTGLSSRTCASVVV